MLGVHVDVHAWGVGYAVGDCNVATMYLLYWAWQIWSVLPVCRNYGVHEQCWVCMVCMVSMVYGLYGMLEPFERDRRIYTPDIYFP